MCQLRDMTSNWEELLTNLKESNPIELAELTVAQVICHQHTCEWWSTFTLKKRRCIICAVKIRFLKKTHKFGIEIPYTIANAKRIANANGNRCQQDATSKDDKSNC